MSAFGKIECGYNIADETINFGSRCLADGDNLYETSTLATLKCSEENEKKANPHINAAVQNGQICFNVDASMRIFKDEQCSDVIFSAAFEAIVDSFCLSLDGKYLLVCLRNGNVRLLDCEDDYTCIFAKSCERDAAGDKFFINSFLDGACFVIVTKTGQVHLLLTTDLKFECVHEFNFTVEVASFQYPFLLVGGIRLGIFNFISNSISSRSKEFKKIFPLSHMFLALNAEGHLCRICAITLLIFPINHSVVYKDMQLLCGSNQQGLIVIREDESQQNFIELLSYPDFTTTYSLKVSNEIQLLSLESLNSEVIHISKIFTDDYISELRFHVVYETDPQQRLLRLLKRQRYEEAEKFATLFHLNKTLINKAKAQEIVEKPLCNSEDINNLINLLDTTEDDEFKLQCCLNIECSCSRLEDVKRVLNYGCKIQLKKQDKQAAELQSSLIDLMCRFNTFAAINHGSDQIIQSWLQFANRDLIQEVILLLKNYQIEEAKIIYSQLDELTTKNLTEDHISDMLGVLNNLPIKTYQPFLPNFIPITLSALPSTLPLFVKWTYNKVFYLENRSKSDFPNNAIKFTEKIVGLIRITDVSDISFQRQCVLHRDSLLRLSSLLSALKILQTLKDEYRISIPVAGYLSGPQNVVRLLLNIKMHPEDYSVFLKKFLCNYMVENHMEPNEILLGEIDDLMKYEERYWTNIIESILNCISSVSAKLEAVKIIFGFAAVPWSDTVRKITHDSLKFSHILTSEIKENIENEPRVVVLKKAKYRIKERRINRINDLKFTLKRIIYCNEPTMVEDAFTLCKTAEDRHVANMLIISHLIRIGCFGKAVKLLDDNTPEELLDCAQELANTVGSVMDNGAELSDELVNNYYSMIGAIFKRLNNGVVFFLQSNNEKRENLIRNIFNLHKHFGIKTTTDDLLSLSIKDKMVDDILERTRRDFEMGKYTVDELFTVCYKLSTSLNLDYTKILMNFCQKSEDYNVIFKTAQRIFDSETSSKNLCLMTVLLLKYVGTYKLQLTDNNSFSESEESLILSDSESIIDDDVFCKGLQLADSIVSKAVHLTQPEDHSSCTHLARWITPSFYFTRSQATELKKMLFGDMYDSASILPGFLTFSTINKVFNAFCSFIGSLNNPVNTYLTHFNSTTITEESLFNSLKSILAVLDNLSKEGQHFTSYKLVETLQIGLSQVPNLDSSIFNFLSDLLKKRCIPKVSASILSNNVVDTDLLHNLLVSCDRDDAIKFMVNSLRMYKRHPRKFASISKAALRVCRFHELPTENTDIMKALITLKWWKKFENKKLDYDYFFKSKPIDRFELLINSNCLDIKLIEEYCQDYKLDLKASYSLLLKRLFQNWKPEYEIKVDMNKKFLAINEGEDELLAKCKEVMNVIDKKQVVSIIKNVWNSVNTYYYEVFIVMINILSELEPQEDNNTQLQMLHFLKIYQRVGKPTETEIEQWYTNFPDTQFLDPLSEFRLAFMPLLFTKHIFNIIRPEVNLKTYQLWFDASTFLKPYLNINEICSFVVKDVVASGILSTDATDTWILHSKHDDLFKEIDDCVRYISDLELTTSVIYHLMTHTPNGADQVTAAKLCHKYAIQYRKLNPDSNVVEKAVIKVEKKYFTYCVLHILHTHQLAEKKYMDLTTQPNELILALYMDDRIVRTNEVALRCPDINKAVEAVATLFNFDIKRIRLNLINNWLDDNCPHFEFDSSVIYSNEPGSGDDNLSRIAYVCCAGEVKYWQTLLYKIGMDWETEEQKSVHCKARALKVFAMISDIETIVELSDDKSDDVTYEGFMNFIDKLTVLSNLQYLGISLEVEALDRYNKKELLNRLVQRAGNVLAIRTMALICITYKIYEAKYWEFIINSTIKFSMFVELKTYINFLKNVKYQFKSFYINAWQKLIDNSFAHLDNIEELDQVLLNNFLTIQSCPVLYYLNFENAFTRCMNREKVEFAAVLLQYFEGSERVECVGKIRESKKDLGVCLNNLEQNGLWGISHVKTMLALREN